MDSFDYSGPKFEDARVIVTPRAVIVLFDDEQALHALYVDAEGRYGAVRGGAGT